MRLFALFFLTLLSCSTKQEKLVSWQGIFFDIPFELHIEGPLSTQQKNQIQSTICDTFTLADTCFNHWNPDSEIATINRSDLLSHSISKELRAIIEVAATAHTLTKGYFDPGMRDYIQRVKSAMKAGYLPMPPTSPQGFSKIYLGSKLHFSQKITLDFDGIVKGYIVDLLRDKLKKLKHNNFLINWSGDIYAAGFHPEGRKWKVWVPALCKEIELTDCALATSGSEAQHWEIDGTTYTHIINPKTLQPLQANRPLSLTIEGPSCAMADALATALLCNEGQLDQNISYHIHN